ncbi:MAG: hypothetical protein ACKO38_02350 [Planctomycetota bacterium]
MNRHPRNTHDSQDFPEEFERQLYRLADGELPADERRQFLRQLDELPGGWRRCALAFLENQAFSVDFPAAMATTESASKPVPPRGSRWLTWSVAVAASWLAMFTLGGIWNGWNRSEGTHNTRPVGLPPAVERMLVREQWDEEAQRERRNSPTPESFSLPPKLAADLLPETELFDNELLMSDILERFRQQGLEPKVLDSYLPVQLKDGRRLIIPKYKRERGRP